MEQGVGGRTFFYELAGEGRPMVLLHGWQLDHRAMMHAIEPALHFRAGWKRIYPDLPGMGGTSGAGLSNQDEVLDALIGFIEAVTGGDRFVIGGFSYGAYLALGVACKYQQLLDGLLIVAPAGLPGGGGVPTLPSHRTIVSHPDLLAELDEEMAEGFRRTAVVQSRELLDAITTLALPAIQNADHEYLAALDRNWAFSFDIECLQTPFPGPTLVVAGRHDARVGYYDAYGLLKNYPRGTFAVLDRAGHALMIEQRALFAALVAEWIDRVEEYSSTGSGHPDTG
jgi:pimeloyl-ACP methyl ester carboxylesterase